MRPVLRQCPSCDGSLDVTRLWCPECDLTIEGRFDQGPLAELSREQLTFVETFVRCEGKFTRMEREMGMSYPTLRSRLHDIIRVLGHEPGEETPEPPDRETRQTILDALDSGEIDAETALRQLHGDKEE